MTTPVAVRASGSHVSFFGHSFLTGETPTSILGLIIAGRNVPYKNASIGGNFLNLMVNSAPRKVHPWGPIAPNSGLILLAGINDYATPFFRTGAAVYADHVTIATAAKLAGFDWVLPATCPFGIGATANDAERIIGNGLLLANAGTAPFQHGVVDLAASSILAADIAAGDGTHPFTIAGRQEIADLFDPYLDALLV